METFDVVVIGAGPGGYPAAIRAAQLGAKVAIVEKEHPGGTCLNWGCIPTKALIASAETVHRLKHGQVLGIDGTEISFDYGAMVSRKDDVVIKLRGGVAQLLKANRITSFKGTASFESRDRIRISGETDTTIVGDEVIIATGATSTVPAFLPRQERVVESRAFLALSQLPDRLLVLGGGVIGCEFACMAAQLGVEVTLVELLDDILIMLDKDVRREVRRVMKKELGIRVLTGTSLEDIKADDMGVTARCGDQSLEADMLLAAVGRNPETSGLDLEKAGVSVDKGGFIPVDDFGLTNVATIYAIGDVNGRHQLAHAATSQGIVAAENACGTERRAMESIVPACIFTHPEVGAVGLSEQEAKEQGRAIKTGKYRFAGLGKAMAAGDTTGFVKWVADAQTDQLLGAHAVGPHATELIAEAAIAIRAELTAAELGRTIHCHLTFGEAWMEAAHDLHGVCIHGAPRKQ